MRPAPTCSKAGPRRRSIRAAARARRNRSSARTRRSTAGTTRRSSIRSPRALALLPYRLALVVWQAVTLLLYLLAIRAIVGSASWPARPGQPVLLARARRRRCRAKPGHDGACGCCSPSPSRPCSSISATAITASSPRRCSASRWSMLDRASGGRRHPVRPARLQAAVRPDDPAGARSPPAAGAPCSPQPRRSRRWRSPSRSRSASRPGAHSSHSAGFTRARARGGRHRAGT